MKLKLRSQIGKAVLAAVATVPVSVAGVASVSVAAGTIHYVAASGSVGTGQSCASPGYVGATHASIQSAINAASDGDTVNICAGTYNISSRLNVAKSLTIKGAGSDLTILDGGGSIQIMIIQDNNIDDGNSGDEITVNVEDLQFRNGNAQQVGLLGECEDGNRCGGALFAENESRVNVSGVYFKDNISDFIGGGFARFLSSNQYPNVPSAIRNSTFEGNKARLDGGAIATLFGFGLTIERSTFYRNGLLDTHMARSASAIIANFADATINESTLVDNEAPSGQTVLYGSITVNRSLIAQTATTATNICNGSQTISGSRANLVTDGSCGITATPATAAAGDSARTTLADLKLGTFSSRGYDTKTVPLMSGSVALDFYSGSCSGTDQIGTTVPAGSNCDVGAYERPAGQGLNTPTGWTYPASSIDRGYATEMAVSSPAADPAGRGVDYDSSTPGVCSITAAGRIQTSSTGTCTVTATGPGWLTRDESTVSRTITVTETPANSTTTTTTTTTTVAPTVTTAPPVTTTAAPVTQTTSALSPESVSEVSAVASAAPLTTVRSAATDENNDAANAAAAPVVTAPAGSTTIPATTTTIPAPDAPEVAPGEAGAIIDGQTVEAQLTREDNSLRLAVGTMSATVYGETADGERIALDADGNLQLDQGDNVVVEGNGFEAGSTVDIWLFSTPTRLGDLVASSSGTVSGSFPVPASIEAGAHRLVLEGMSTDGKDAVIGVGLYLGDYETEGGFNRMFIIVPLVLATILGLVIPTTVRRRREQLLNG